MEEQKVVNLITHNGVFHSDDVMAYTFLKEFYELSGFSVNLIRTRNTNVIQKYVSNLNYIDGLPNTVIFDVGSSYNKEKFIFDHHMKNAPIRENGIKYSSVGLCWEYFGEKFLLKKFPDLDQKEIFYMFNQIEKEIIIPIDNVDNGVSRPNTVDFSVIIGLNNLNFMENKENEKDSFLDSVNLANNFLNRFIALNYSTLKAKKIFDVAFENRIDNNIVELAQENIPWTEIIFIEEEKYNDLLFIIAKGSNDKWFVFSIPPEKYSFEKRMPLPENWGGLEYEALEKESGIE